MVADARQKHVGLHRGLVINILLRLDQQFYRVMQFLARGAVLRYAVMETSIRDLVDENGIHGMNRCGGAIETYLTQVSQDLRQLNSMYAAFFLHSPRCAQLAQVS